MLDDDFDIQINSLVGGTTLAMLIYGLIALMSEKITFDYKIAVGGIVLTFIIDVISHFIPKR